MRFKQFLESYTEGPSSTVTHDGRQYKLDCIFKLADTIVVESFPVDRLKWMLDGSWSKKDEKRVELIDLSAPIIVTPWNGLYVIIDGLHRVHEAVKLGIEHLPAKIIFQHDLDSCVLKPD